MKNSRLVSLHYKLQPSVCLVIFVTISEKREKNTKASEETQTSRSVSLHYLLFIVTAILFSRAA
jgi:hypothetical protein